jgi:hypothetical protein
VSGRRASEALHPSSTRIFDRRGRNAESERQEQNQEPYPTLTQGIAAWYYGITHIHTCIIL